MNIILLGAPGAGKGTQAEFLEKKLNIPQISTGVLFRKEMAEKTPLGKEITDVMDSGKLVSNDLTMKVLKKRLMEKDCEKGALLDGTTRNIDQAERLETLFKEMGRKLDLVLYIALPEEEIITRLTRRLTCKMNNHVFHEVYNPPKDPKVCDFDGSELYKRDDQKIEVVKERIRVYNKSTQPLIDYYKEKGLLAQIDGTKTIKEVAKEIDNHL